MTLPYVEEQFAEQLPECPESGVGCQLGGIYNRSKFASAPHELNCTVNISEDNIQLYGLFCGFNNGLDVAHYAMNRIVYEVFRDQPINRSMSTCEVIAALREKFKVVDERLIASREPDLSERFILKDADTEGNSDRIAELDAKISGGCTVLLVLKIDSDIYTLCCGTSQAIVVRSDRSAFLLSESVHDNQNIAEIDRLRSIGVNEKNVVGTTRAIGDFFRRSLFEENPALCSASEAPVIAEPEIFHKKIKDSWQYLIIMSDGVSQNLKDAEVDDIIMEVAENVREERTVTSTAQGLVDTFARKHKEAHSKHLREFGDSVKPTREEMTVIFVKLRKESSFINTLDSSCGSTGPNLLMGPITPYVDIDEMKSEKILHKVGHLLLSEG